MYKAWHKKNKKMYKVNAISWVHECVNCCNLDEEYTCRWTFTFDEIILLKNTGFYNDEDFIYVGDIVLYGNHYYKVVEDLHTFGLVRLDRKNIDYDDFEQSIYSCGDSEPSFQGLRNDYIVSLFEIACNMQEVDTSLDCEIIGNIYENEGLL